MKYGNYDAWKLATPWDDEPELPEIFQSLMFEAFSEDEKLIDQFDTAVKRMSDKLSVEDLEEFAIDLMDNLGLDGSEDDCITRIGEQEYGEYLDAVENGYRGKFRSKRRY